MAHTVRYLTSEETGTLARPSEYVEAVRAGYRERGNGAPATVRERLSSDRPGGILTSYMTLLSEMGAMGGYMYSAGFASRSAWFVTPIFDADEGSPLALIEGAQMNPFKTGAAGAVAVDELARSDASQLGVIGSGRQARGQVYTTVNIRDIECIRVYSPTDENRRSFVEELKEDGDIEARPAKDAEEVVRESDIIITATTAEQPVFKGEHLEGGEHITAMGQYHPEKREVDGLTVQKSLYVPDLQGRVRKDAGAYLLAQKEGYIGDDHIHAELGDIVAGQTEGRQTEEDITLFDSGGTGIETVAAGYMLYRKAEEQEIGTLLPFSDANSAMSGRPHPKFRP